MSSSQVVVRQLSELRIVRSQVRNPRHIASERPATTAAFTLIELLVVISIIIILAGLILSTVGYVQKKGARSRAEAEIAAMSAAVENYKADNGIYPRDSNTDALTAVTDQTYSTKNPPDPVPTSYDADPRQSSGGPNAYKAASFSL